MTPAPASEPSAEAREAARAAMTVDGIIFPYVGLSVTKIVMRQVAAVIDAAVQGERERAAKVCEDQEVALVFGENSHLKAVRSFNEGCRACARAIREGRTP